MEEVRAFPNAAGRGKVEGPPSNDGSLLLKGDPWIVGRGLQNGAKVAGLRYSC